MDCGIPWTLEAIDLAVQRGAHRSATTPDAMVLVAEDIHYQVQAGFAQILEWEAIKDHLPKNFKVSPLAVVPQQNRRDRLILDLSFPVRRQSKSNKHRLGAVLAPAVNDATTVLSPQLPVKELGTVLPRLLAFMQSVPPDEHIVFSKLDLADGFWRMVVPSDDAWNFCFVLPEPGREHNPRIVVPSALQMGWTESPAYFCTATETSRDVVDLLVDSDVLLPRHPMELLLLPPSLPPSIVSRPNRSWIGVYMDDFLLAAVVNDLAVDFLTHVSRASLWGIHAFFPPVDITGHLNGKDPISQKKLEKGDGIFLTKKVILGFAFHGSDRTVTLPPAKALAIVLQTRQLLRKTTCARKRFQSVVGKLRHAASILPAGKGLFSPINDALQGSLPRIGLGQQSDVRQTLLDLISLIQSLASRPTHICELLPDDPEYIGFCDASAAGAGGVWFAPCFTDTNLCTFTPRVWRLPFPADITASVVSVSNPSGTLTNSDLELAALLLHVLVLETIAKLWRCHIAAYSDNTPTVAWVERMASRSKCPIAGRLLRGLAMRQRVTASAPVAVHHIAGDANILADISSRSFRTFAQAPWSSFPTETDTDFLVAFDASFPLCPQAGSWKLASPDPAMTSNVILTLRNRRLPMHAWTALPALATGGTGRTIPPQPSATPIWPPVHAPLPSNYFWPSRLGSAPATMGKVDGLVPSLSKLPYATSANILSWLDTRTLAALTVPRS